MKFIPHAAEFGNEGLRIDLGYTGNERRDGKYNSFENPKDWDIQVLLVRFKYFLVLFDICRLHRYPFGLYFATSLGCKMLHMRAFWLQVNIHWAGWFLLKNGLSI